MRHGRAYQLKLLLLKVFNNVVILVVMETKLHSRLHDKILNSVPIEEILEVNEMELQEGNSDVIGCVEEEIEEGSTKAMMKR